MYEPVLTVAEAEALMALLHRVGPTTLFAALGCLCEGKVAESHASRDPTSARHWADLSLEFSRLERRTRDKFGA